MRLPFEGDYLSWATNIKGITVYMSLSQMVAELGLIITGVFVLYLFLRPFGASSIQRGLLFKGIL